MIAFDIEYRGRNIKVEGPDRVVAEAEKDIVTELKTNLISTALQLLKTEQDSGDFPKTNFLTFVDNKIDVSELKVKPFGVIQYSTKLQNITPVLLFAVRAIVDRAPVGSGAYLQNIALFRNKQLVAKSPTGIISYINKIQDFRSNEEFRFINASPYARKLERYRVTKSRRGSGNISKGKKRSKVKGKLAVAPAGAFVLSTRSIKRKFKELKNNIRFSFIPIDPNTARRLDSSGKDTTGYVFAKARNVSGRGRPYLYPSITITTNTSNIGFNRGFTEDAGL